MATFSVKFRGDEMDVRIVHDGGYEHDTGAHEVEWEFCGITPAEIEALNITEDEYQEIEDQVYEVLNDPYYYDDFYG